MENLQLRSFDLEAKLALFGPDNSELIGRLEERGERDHMQTSHADRLCKPPMQIADAAVLRRRSVACSCKVGSRWVELGVPMQIADAAVLRRRMLLCRVEVPILTG